MLYYEGFNVCYAVLVAVPVILIVAYFEPYKNRVCSEGSKCLTRGECKY